MILLKRNLVHFNTLFNIIFLKDILYMSVHPSKWNFKSTSCTCLYLLQYDIIRNAFLHACTLFNMILLKRKLVHFYTLFNIIFLKRYLVYVCTPFEMKCKCSSCTCLYLLQYDIITNAFLHVCTLFNMILLKRKLVHFYTLFNIIFLKRYLVHVCTPFKTKF